MSLSYIIYDQHRKSFCVSLESHCITSRHMMRNTNWWAHHTNWWAPQANRAALSPYNITLQTFLHNHSLLSWHYYIIMSRVTSHRQYIHQVIIKPCVSCVWGESSSVMNPQVIVNTYTNWSSTEKRCATSSLWAHKHSCGSVLHRAMCHFVLISYPLLPTKSPIFPQKCALSPQKTLYFHKTAACSRKRALYSAKETSFSVKEPSFSQKSPLFRNRALYPAKKILIEALYMCVDQYTYIYV